MNLIQNSWNDSEEIFRYSMKYNTKKMNLAGFQEELSFFKGKILNFDILDSKNGKIILTKGTKVNQKKSMI